ncbi:MAG: Co2+/Mg2+ efflux protein ApaG [Pseudomonadota bacterium]
MDKPAGHGTSQTGDANAAPPSVPPMFERRTKDVIVRVEPEYLAEQSSPSDGRYIWAYTVEIDNQSPNDLRVTERYWHIADSRGQVQEVRGQGVVGEKPVVKAGEQFRYTSGAPLSAPSGMMSGSYRVESDNGDAYDIAIPVFVLDSPYEGTLFN